MGALPRLSVSASAVENVAAEGVGFGEGGVVEVLGRVAGHADLLHDAAGGEIGRGGKRHDFGEAKGFESVFEGGQGAFGGQALIPVGGGEAPADFDAGRKGELEPGDVEADVADAFARRAEFGGPEAVAVLLEVGVDALEHGVGVGGGHESGEVAHDGRVGIEGDEGGAVGGLPEAEEEAWRGQHFPSILG